MQSKEYKMSVKPLSEARQTFRWMTAGVLCSYFGVIWLFAFGLESYYSYSNSRIVIPIILTCMFVPLLLSHFWLRGKYFMTADGIFHSEFPFGETFIPWIQVYDIIRTTMYSGRSDCIDVLVFCLDFSDKNKYGKFKRVHDPGYYFFRQKKYFVIRYSEVRSECAHRYWGGNIEDG